MTLPGIQAKRFVNGSVKLCFGIALVLMMAQAARAEDEIKPPVVDLSEYLNPIAEQKAQETERRFAELIRGISADPKAPVFPTLETAQKDDEPEDNEQDSDDSDREDDENEDGDNEGNESEEESPVRLARFENGRFELPELIAASIATEQIGNGKIPEGFREGASPVLAPLPESGVDRGNWDYATEYWAAANTFSHPRYFEERMLERHGHERFPCLQPVVSGVHFFGTVPLLPYLMTVSHPCECEYTLGYFRSGSCVPRYRQRPPYKREAILAEAAAIAAGVLIFP